MGDTSLKWTGVWSVGLMDNAGDDSDADDADELEHDQRSLQRPLHARQRPSGLQYSCCRGLNVQYTMSQKNALPSFE